MAISSDEAHRNGLEVGIELEAPWSANQELQATDDLTGNILKVLYDGTDGIAVSRDENSFGDGSRSASTS